MAISWDDYFMGVALLSAQRSKDPNTQVGACIVNDDRHIVGVGYNGMPNGTKDAEAHWDREGDFENTKYAYVVHSELNAILNSNGSVKGCYEEFSKKVSYFKIGTPTQFYQMYRSKTGSF